MLRIATGSPCEILQPFVHGYQLITLTFTTGYVDEVVPPHVTPVLIFNAGPRKTVLTGQQQVFTDTFMLPPCSHCCQLRFFPGMRIFIVHFKADGYYKIFGPTLPDIFRHIRLLLRAENSFSRQVRIAESFLIRSLDCSTRYFRSISSAIALIQSTNGNAHISELERETFIAKRTLERQFLLQTGLHVKLFSRIVRFRKLMQCAAEEQTASRAELARMCGFYDQKHLLQEWRYFTGCPPGSPFPDVASGTGAGLLNNVTFFPVF